MTRKKLIISILVGAAVTGTAIYLFGTASGKKEWKRLKKTGSVAAGTFTTLGKEIARNRKQEKKETMLKALKAYWEGTAVA